MKMLLDSRGIIYLQGVKGCTQILGWRGGGYVKWGYVQGEIITDPPSLYYFLFISFILIEQQKN